MHPLLRFTLDLFESNQPLGQVNKALGATKNRSIKSIATKPVAANTIEFRHPQASREVQLGHALVAYAFKRGQRRSIGFHVSAEGLSVRAPNWLVLAEVDAAVQAKASWILRKLQETRQRQTRLAAHTIVWQDGANLPYLGQSIRLQLDPSHAFDAAGAQLLPAGDVLTASAGSACVPTLRLALPHHATAQQIQDVAQAWLMRQAHAHFQQRLNHFAPLLGVQWKKLSLSQAQTRWGSAKADGSIRLNWRLIHLKTSVIDYVVAHELSHLRVMNHSPRFWDTVRSVVPDYAQLRQQLRTDASPR